MIQDARRFFDDGEKMQLQLHRPQHASRHRHASSAPRSRASSACSGLKPGHITVRLRGSAGQSLGAFAVQGLKLEVFGDANDYVGKGLSGGTIVVRPLPSSPLIDQRERHHRQHRALWRDRGKLFAAGQAGERFAVRNSGAIDGGRRLRLQRLRIHDRRHGGDPRRGRRQLRRRHDRRHGLRLRRDRRLSRCM